jgi:hypothetical protein
MTSQLMIATAAALSLHALAQGGVVVYTDFSAWSAAVADNVTTIDFTGYPDGTFITNQYSDLGVTFLDGNDNIYLVPPPTFADGAGVDGNATTTLQFVNPISAIAVTYPGNVQFDLLLHGDLIYSSPNSPGGGVGFFYGLVSTAPFNGLILDNPFSPNVAFDDLHFAPPVPVSSTPILSCLAALGTVGRRRRR